MKRGEIWTASGGSDYAGKPRPVLIVQDDSFDGTESVTICLLTSHAMDAPLVRPVIEAREDNGLRETSYAMVDKLTTVKRPRLGRRIGTLTPSEMTAVSRAILVFLGLVVPGRGRRARAASAKAAATAPKATAGRSRNSLRRF